MAAEAPRDRRRQRGDGGEVIAERARRAPMKETLVGLGLGDAGGDGEEPAESASMRPAQPGERMEPWDSKAVAEAAGVGPLGDGNRDGSSRDGGDRDGSGSVAAAGPRPVPREAAAWANQRSGQGPAAQATGAATAHGAQASPASQAAQTAQTAQASQAAQTAQTAQASQAAQTAQAAQASLRRRLAFYLLGNERQVWSAVGEHARGVEFPSPHPRLSWAHQATFVRALLRQLESQLGDFQPLERLDDVLLPSSASRTLGELLPATDAWSPPLGLALAQALQLAIVASLRRLGPRYVAVADAAGIVGDEAVTASAILTTLPIDRLVAAAMAAPRGLSVEPPAPGRAPDVAPGTMATPASAAGARSVAQVEVLTALHDCSLQLAFAQAEAQPWGLADRVAPALAFVHRKQLEVLAIDAKVEDWLRVISGQRERLVRITGGLHRLTEAAQQLGLRDRRSMEAPEARPVREILELLARAAGTSHRAQTSEALLAQALELQASLSVRAVQATERDLEAANLEVHASLGSTRGTAQISHDAAGLQERSRRLQTQLINGSEVDAAELDEVTLASEELALRARLLGTLHSVSELRLSAIDASDGLSAHVAQLFSGKFRDLAGVCAHLTEQLAPIQATWMAATRQLSEAAPRQAGTPEPQGQRRAARRAALTRAQRALAALAQERDLQHFLREGAKVVQNQQFRTACVQIAAMIGSACWPRPAAARRPSSPAAC